VIGFVVRDGVVRCSRQHRFDNTNCINPESLRMPFHVLVLIELSPDKPALFEAAGFQLVWALGPADRAAALAAHGDRIQAVLTNGTTGFRADEIAALPKLEIICALGAGHENIDVAAARARNIVVTNGAGTNDVTVADHAMALLMAVARGIPQADARVRQGDFGRSTYQQPLISGKKLGILGLGTIGLQIARRGHLGFAMEVAYHNRKPRENVPYLYQSTVAALADWADFMVVATPGGNGTRHLVDTMVLSALGAGGYLINIARGSVVDTTALIHALKTDGIAGAALDVVEGEPDVPADLIALSNVIFTPHVAGRSPEAIAATAQLAIDNLSAHFSGKPVLTPVGLGKTSN
jgi:lactate dehydrogenase-like 2-hydroxyacid dehydrogenase